MIRLFILLLVAVLTFAFDYFGSFEAVEISWLSYDIKISSAFFIGGGVFVFLIAMMFFQIIVGIFELPKRMKARRKLKTLNHGLQEMASCLSELASGRENIAQKHAEKAALQLPNSPLPDFFLGKIAEQKKAIPKARQHYEKLMNKKETSFLGLRNLITIAMQNNNYADLDYYLIEASKVAPQTPWVLHMLFDVALHKQEWQQAESALDKLLLAKLIDKSEAKHKRAVLYLIQAAAKTYSNEGAHQFALKAYKLEPSFVPAVVGYGQFLIEKGEDRKIRRMVKKLWKTSPHQALADLYMKAINYKDDLQFYSQIAELFKMNPTAWLSGKIMAEAGIKAELWGQAREHLVTISKYKLTKSLCHLFAELEEKEYQNHEQAHQWQKKAVDALIDPHWVCDSCATIYNAWYGICPHCESFDALNWVWDNHSMPGVVIKENTSQDPLLLFPDNTQRQLR
jgi:HemY protein